MAKPIASILSVAGAVAIAGLASCSEEVPPQTSITMAAIESGGCDDGSDCDDGNPCTSDWCDENGDCKHERICCNTELCTISEVQARRDTYRAFFNVNGNPCEHVGFGVLGRNWSRDAVPAWSPWTATGYAWGNHGRPYGDGNHIARATLNTKQFRYQCCVHGEEHMMMPPSVQAANNAEATRETQLGTFLGMIPDEACEALCGHWGAIVYRLPNAVHLDGAFINNGHNSNVDGHRTENMIAKAFGLTNPLPNATQAYCQTFCGLAISENKATCQY